MMDIEFYGHIITGSRGFVVSLRERMGW